MDSLPSPPVCVPRAPDPVTGPTSGGQPTISPSVGTTCTRPCNRTHCWWTAYHLPQSHVVVPVEHTVPSIVAGPQVMSQSLVPTSGRANGSTVCVFVCAYAYVCSCMYVHVLCACMCPCVCVRMCMRVGPRVLGCKGCGRSSEE